MMDYTCLSKINNQMTIQVQRRLRILLDKLQYFSIYILCIRND